MNKKFTMWLVGLLCLVPIAVSADVMSGNNQLISLYQQLITLLQQEIAMLQGTHPATASSVISSTGVLMVSPATGPAPLAVTFTLATPNQTEAIDFGDGHSSGSGGCPKNKLGYCDLSKPIAHSYMYPGAYTVTLFDHGADAHVVSTQKITVLGTGAAMSH